MKSMFRKPYFLIAVISAAVTLTGCAGTQDANQSGMMGGASAQGGMMSQGSGGQMGMMGQGGQMDMKSMCEMHDKMKNAGTQAERSAMMNERMKNMSPEMQQQHMEMMQKQCK